MLSETSPQSNLPNKNSQLPQLKVSYVDKVASLLMSCFIMVTAVVCFLGAAFLLSKIQENDSGSFDGGGWRGPLHRSEYISALEHARELMELPESEHWKETPSDQALDTIQMVSLIETNATTISEAFDAKDQNGPKADPRGEGIPQDGPGSFAIPSGTRWELRFSATDRKSYAQQLDSLGIELGVYGAGRPVVEYASKLTNNKPTYRRGSPSDEHRPYFMSITNGVLKEYDLQLLKLAGIEMLGRQPIKFVSRETEDKLVQLEIEHAYAKMGTSFPLERVYRTVFECRPNVNGDGFEMFVVSQRYKSN